MIDFHKKLGFQINRVFGNSVKDVPRTLDGLASFAVIIQNEAIKATRDYEHYQENFNEVFAREFGKIHSGNAEVKFDYDIDNSTGQNGTVHIVLSGTGPGSKDDTVDNLYDAFIRSESDVNNFLLAYEAMKRFVSKVGTLKDVSFYAQDSYDDTGRLNHLSADNWQNGKGESILSPRAVMRLYLRFCGVLVHTINTWFTPAEGIIRALEESSK